MKRLLVHINNIIEPFNDNKMSRIYDWVMLIAIVIGIFPLLFRMHHELFWYFDLVSCVCFIVDYLLRWVTSVIRSEKHSWVAAVRYPFTPMAIIDLLSILPTINLLTPTFKVARVSRLLRLLRVIKIIRYYEPLEIGPYSHWLYSTSSLRPSSCSMLRKTSILKRVNISSLLSSMLSIGQLVRLLR